MDEYDTAPEPAGPKWETVTKAPKSASEHTERLRVEGGWLYRSSLILLGVTMVFVPDPPLPEHPPEIDVRPDARPMLSQ